MRKTILLIATFALTLASCSNDEDLGFTNQPDNAIEFRTLTDKGTRAAITDETNILSFTVTGIKDALAGGGYLFNAFGITRGEDSNWDYTPKRFWPADGSVDFYAYSPSSSKNVTSGIKNYTSGNTLDYRVPKISKTNAQEDFLVARITGQDKNTTAVKLNFHHTLSRIMFFAKTSQENVTYTIHNVELLHLNQTGKLNLDAPEIVESGAIAYGSTPTVVWTGQADMGNYTVDMGESPIYLLNKYASILGETGAMLVMPQGTKLSSGGTGSTPPVSTPGAEEFAIKVSYKAFDGDIYYAGNSTTPKVKYFAVKDLLGGTGGITFEMGRQYNFYLGFGEDVSGEIKFEVGVSEWNDTPNTYIPELDNYKGLISDDLARIANPTFDTDQTVTYEQIQAKTSITANTATFDFEGLEYFKKLETLAISGVTSGSNLDASKNILLTKVTIANSTLGEVNLSNGVLEELEFTGTNTVTTLDASKTKLNTVSFATGTVINGDLDLSNNAALTSINLNGVTINGKLDLSDTGVASATIVSATLDVVDLSDAALATLTFSGTNTITTLNASNNKLTAVTLNPGTVITNGLDLSGNPTLNQPIVLTGMKITGNLNLSNTNITNVEIKGGATLGDVNLQSNPSLTKLEFSGSNKINSLAASNGKLETVTFMSGTNITGNANIDLSGNALLQSVALTTVTIAGTLNLSDCSISSVSMELGTSPSGNIGALNLSNNLLAGTVTIKTATFGDLNLSNNAIKTLDIPRTAVSGVLDLKGNTTLEGIKLHDSSSVNTQRITIGKLDISDSKALESYSINLYYGVTINTVVVWSGWNTNIFGRHSGYQNDTTIFLSTVIKAINSNGTSESIPTF